MGLFSKIKGAQQQAGPRPPGGFGTEQMMGGDMATQAAQAQLYQRLATSRRRGAGGRSTPSARSAAPISAGATPHEFDVTITPPGGSPYQTTIRQGMLPVQMEGISQGMAFVAKYDPEQPHEREPLQLVDLDGFLQGHEGRHRRRQEPR